MVIVISLETGKRLESLAQAHKLEIPTPISSSCDSYLSPEELAQILKELAPLASQNEPAADLVAELNQYAQNPRSVEPCPDTGWK